ncbi:dihydroorotase [Bacteroidota bacterium]
MFDGLIKNARIVNEGQVINGSLLLHEGKIHSILSTKDPLPGEIRNIIDARGRILLPGIIDDQVHFREPGLTHKGDIYSESRAAVAGGITSYMEMPNTMPQTTTLDELERKYELAGEKSIANFGFYLGATNDNIEEIRNLKPGQSPGVKIFMGASTGNMLVDDDDALEAIFADSPVLIATHCEDETIIRAQKEIYLKKYGNDVPISCHPEIRNEEACYSSSSKAVELALKHKARLHVLHISTKKELELFSNTIPLEQKQITAEVCVHHLWFDDRDYANQGSLIKWNPAVKTSADRDGLRAGLLDNHLDIIATDHAPHTLEEKNNHYFKSPSGGPLVQHSLISMMELHKQGMIDLPTLVEKMCHSPAKIFDVKERGFIREGYFADLVILEDAEWTVNKDNILYKCGWSPFEGQSFSSRIACTFVNGQVVYEWDDSMNTHRFTQGITGKRLEFNR